MQGYTIEYLKGLDDFGDVEQIAEEWGVNLSGLADLESMVERLVLHRLKESGQQYFKIDGASFHIMKSQHQMKTKAIVDLLKKVRESIGPCMIPIGAILKAGNMSDDLDADFSNYIRDLESQECCVVVSGETGAGKSSILNLILGMNILPTHSLSCTFLICKIKYGSTFGSKLYYDDGSTIEAKYETLEEAREYLDRTVFEKNLCNRDSVSKIQEIEIYLPAEILKCGITIVDTPGFGENEKLNKMVAEFLSTKTISAFVYLIKSDNAGGVQEDRLLDFLRDIRRMRKTSASCLREDMPPNAALFICNRWDKITEHDKVRKNALSKLRDAWPGFEDKQAIFFSTEKAAQHTGVDIDYISQEYADLLQKLVDLLQTALDSSIKRYYRWLKKILQQATGHVLSLVSQIDKSDADLNKKFDDAKTKLAALGTNTQNVVSALTTVIEDKTQLLAEQIKQFLRDPETKLSIRSWDLKSSLHLRRSSTASLASTISSANKKTNSFDSIALRSLVDTIDSWIVQNSIAEKMASEVEQQIDKHLQGLLSEMEAINVEMTDNASVTSFSSSSSLPDEDLEGLLCIVAASTKSQLVHKVERIAEGKSGKNISFQPKVIVARALLSAILAVQSRRRRSNMHTDPNSYVIDRALQFSETMIHNKELLLSLCSRYTDSLVQYVKYIERNIPHFIASTKELMDEIQRARSLARGNKEQFKHTLRHLEKAVDNFRGFGLTYISDIRASSLSICLDIDPLLTTSSRSALDRSLNDATAGFTYGVCFYTQMGTVELEGRQTYFTSRTNNTSLPEEVIYNETIKLKELSHRNVATFLGVVRRVEKTTLLFSGDFRPLGKYIRNPLIRDIKTKTWNCIDGLMHGLKYLHGKSLVHMELSPKTIMVDNEIEEVKLMGGCLPRTIPLPRNNDTQFIGGLVYLSPEVLRGGLYSWVDDVYSFGVILCELLTQENPFSDYRSLTLSEFIDTVKPSDMISINENFPAELTRVLKGCLFTSPDERLTMNEVVDSISLPVVQPIIDTLKVRRQRGRVMAYRLSKGGSASSYDD